MKSLSSFTQPQFVPNLFEFLSSAEHKKKIFVRMLVTIQLMAAIDFHSIFFHTVANINCLVTNILQNIIFCIQELEEN